MAETSRRGFLTGLGALLATTALVKVPAVVAEPMTCMVNIPNRIYFLNQDNLFVLSPSHWRDLAEWTSIDYGKTRMAGHLGEYHGMRFVDGAEIVPL